MKPAPAVQEVGRPAASRSNTNIHEDLHRGGGGKVSKAKIGRSYGPLLTKAPAMLPAWREAVNLIELLAGILLSLGTFLILRAVFEADRPDGRAERRLADEPPAEERRAA